MRAPRPSPRASARAPLRQMPVCVTHGLGASESPSLPTLPAPVQPRRPPSPRLLFGARSEVICVLTRLRWSSPQGQHLWVLSAAPPALLGQGLARSRRSDLSLRLRVEEPARHRRWLGEAATQAPNAPSSGAEGPGLAGGWAPLPLQGGADAERSRHSGERGRAGLGCRKQTKNTAAGPRGLDSQTGETVTFGQKRGEEGLREDSAAKRYVTLGRLRLPARSCGLLTSPAATLRPGLVQGGRGRPPTLRIPRSFLRWLEGMGHTSS